MKAEKFKKSLLIKGTADIYHSVTYMYGYQRFWAFSMENSYYELEENQDQDGCIKSKLREITKQDFDALVVRCHQMTRHWKNKRGLKTFREDFRDQVMQFGHDCKKHLYLKKEDVEVFTKNSFSRMLEDL